MEKIKIRKEDTYLQNSGTYYNIVGEENGKTIAYCENAWGAEEHGECFTKEEAEKLLEKLKEKYPEWDSLRIANETYIEVE